MAAGGAALTAYNSKDAVSALANGDMKNAGFSVSITVGSSKSQSDSYQNSTSSHGSNLQAGGNVNLIATGAGKDSNILVQGSDITAGKDVTLIADNQVNLLASQDNSRDRSTNSSSSAAVGVAITYGPKGLAAGITASASKGKGHANSDDVVYSNSHVNAGNTATIQSGGDTTLQGAVVSGKQVVADVGGNLNLESLQDTSTFSGKQQNIGGSVTVGAGFSGSVSYSKSKAKGDFASVNEQTGIQAGDGGFQVNVKGNTDLKGAVIASNQTAIDNNRNSLTTGTLTHSDIENHSDYKASGVNLSGGISVAGSKPAGKPESSGGNTGNNGANWSWHNPNKSGVNSAAAGISSDSGNERSTTHSGISAGAVTITDEAAQQQKTGQSASEAAASIQSNVLTGDGSNGLQKNWDGQKLLQEQAANAQIMATFGQQASRPAGQQASRPARRLALTQISKPLPHAGQTTKPRLVNGTKEVNTELRFTQESVH